MKFYLSLFLAALLLNSLNSQFEFNLFSRMNLDKAGENLIISPLSIYQVLSLTANGAKGVTLSEMLYVLEANTLNEVNQINYQILSIIRDFTTMEIANGVMSRFTPLDSFCTIAENYQAPFEPLVSLEQVNNWVKEKTHGKINKILDSLNPETVMLLLNAIYFNAEWTHQFEKDLTKSLPFYNLGTDEVMVDTMSQIEYFNYYEDKKVQIIELKFNEDFMSALIILPSDLIDINSYVRYLSLAYREFPNALKQLKRTKVHLQLPKFEVNFSEELNQILKDFGMSSAFSPNDADFSGIRKEGGLYINTAIHKTFLKVHEYGTEAAAVSIIGMDEMAYPEDDKIYDMKVDRPFLFFLKNTLLPEGHNLIFMAKIEKIE